MLSKDDMEKIHQWYESHKDEIANECKGHYVTFRTKRDHYMRNFWIKRTEEEKKQGVKATKGPIIINDGDQLMRYIKKLSVVEVIPEIPEINDQEHTNELFIDIDSDLDFETTKMLTMEVFTLFTAIPDMHKVISRHTGGKGFHIRGFISEKIPWEDARSIVENWVVDPFHEKHPKITFPAEFKMPSKEDRKGKFFLDRSSMKKRGAARAELSVHMKTMNYAVSVPFDEIKNFQPKSIFSEVCA